MGVCRDISDCQIDFVKEMAEGLGCTGLRLDNLIDRVHLARSKTVQMIEEYHTRRENLSTDFIRELNKHVIEYNSLVDKAEDTLRWLLIQREACGFRTHKNVSLHYPIPQKIKPIDK